jgi:hemerythrin-like domain-containing protein
VDAIALLREDHVAVLAILDTLDRAPADGRPAGPDDLPARRQLVTELVMAESAHEAIEEEYFWPSVRHWLVEGRELAAPAMEQEQSAKQVLAELDRLEAGEPEFERLVSQIIADAREHIRYEETQVWPVVRQRIARSELEELGRKMAGARKVAPTRPHPHTPAKPGVLKTVGVAAAAADRIRDVATHRHRGVATIPSRPAISPGPPPAQPATPGVRPSMPARVLVTALTLVLIVVAVRRRRTTRRGSAGLGAEHQSG